MNHVSLSPAIVHPPSFDAAVLALAHAAGVVHDWTDATGHAQSVTQDSLRAVLGALGMPCASALQCEESHAHLVAGRRGLPALVTATLESTVTLPLPASAKGMLYRLELESGGVVEGQLSLDADGTICLAAVTQCGYHRLLFADSAITLAVAPARCYSVTDALGLYAGAAGAPHTGARCWGLGAQLYSLRRSGDGGIGDFTALTELTQHAAAQGAASVAISPVHAMFSADPRRFSPYGPSSRLFLNALHIDPATVSGAANLATALSQLDAHARSSLLRLEGEALIDWSAAGRLRMQLLRILFEQATGGERGTRRLGQEFMQFCQQGGEALTDHARFEMLHAQRLAQGVSGDWHDWPQALRDPRSVAVAACAANDQHEVDFHLFLQWQAARGLASAQAGARTAGMPIGLVADLAVGADRGGSQAWSRQSHMLHGLSVGAPPDLLNTRGQDWGLGAFSPQAMQLQGFRGYIEMLRAVFAHCGGVRIDHVLGLSRLWLIPDGAPSSAGAYLKFPMDDLLRLIALESHRHRAIVIGEDLGTVPAGFDARLARSGLLGIRVLYFETAGTHFKPPSAWSDAAIATTTTHDLPTVAGWWQGVDIDWRARLDLLAPGETAAQGHALRACERVALWDAFSRDGVTTEPMPAPDAATAVVDAALAYVGATPAPLVIVPLEDLLGLEQQPNLPGTVDSHPNWRRRLPVSVPALLDSPLVRQRLRDLDAQRTSRTTTVPDAGLPVSRVL